LFNKPIELNTSNSPVLQDALDNETSHEEVTCSPRMHLFDQLLKSKTTVSYLNMF